MAIPDRGPDRAEDYDAGHDRLVRLQLSSQPRALAHSSTATVEGLWNCGKNNARL